MNKIYLITNWKMQLLNKEAVELTKKILKEKPGQNVELVLCPSFTALKSVGEILKGSQIKLGAQDVFYHEEGAYTGEVSPDELNELGVEYVIVGHSERRQNLDESDEDVNRKINMCLDNNLTPIMCVGETFEEKRQGFADNVIIRQITRGLEDVKLKKDQQLIIAYEPVWAISPAPSAQPQDAIDAAEMIKHLLLDFFEPQVIEENIFIIYGGSVDAANVKDFIKHGLLEGVLVGGASLSKDKFIPIINSLKDTRNKIQDTKKLQ